VSPSPVADGVLDGRQAALVAVLVADPLENSLGGETLLLRALLSSAKI
jgi:hypothetical protein